jgi:hypothetical protein
MALETSAPREDVVHLRYRNREVTTADLAFLKEKCASMATRHEVAKAVCDAWSWRQANGAWSVYACADLLLRLEERGLVKLPPSARRTGDRRAFSGLPLPPDLVPLVGLDVRDPDADLDTLCVRPIASEERLDERRRSV